MDDINKIKEQFKLYFDVVSSDSSLDSFYQEPLYLQKSSIALQNVTHRKVSLAQRLPTRRPDPNVHNRNALLARENRRRKKVYLESMEKELVDVRNSNKALLMVVKKQTKAIKRLEQDKRYYKSIFENQSEIFKLIKTLNFNLHSQSPDNIEKSRKELLNFRDSAGLIPTESRSSSCETQINSVNGVNVDNDFEGTESINGLLTDILDASDLRLKNIVSKEAEDNNFIEEHNHVSLQQSTTASRDQDIGICLHLSQGKVSLEFCPYCHVGCSNNTK